METGEVRELYAYRATNMNSGVLSYQRGIYVHGYSVDAASQIPGVPQAGNQHPNYSGYLLTSRTSQVYGRGTLFVCNYVPAEYAQGSVPPVNQYAEGFLGKDVSFDYEEVTIPTWTKFGIESTDASGNPISKVVYGDGRDLPPIRRKVPYYSVPIAFKITVNNTLDDVFMFSDRIVEQTDRLHTIFDRQLLFACNGVNQRGVDEFVANYRWYSDGGVPNDLMDLFDEVLPDSGGSPSNIGRIGSRLYPFFDADYIIPPFKGLYISGSIDPADPPDVVFFDRFKSDPNGWVNLPGVIL